MGVVVEFELLRHNRIRINRVRGSAVNCTLSRQGGFLWSLENIFSEPLFPSDESLNSVEREMGFTESLYHLQHSAFTTNLNTLRQARMCK